MEYIIRESNINDYERIAYICKTSLGYEKDPDFVKERLSTLDNSEKVFVAEANSKVVGFIHVSKYKLLFDDLYINILGIAVDNDYKHNGIGRALINESEKWARSINAKGIRLNSGIVREEAHAFYRKLGFNNEKEQIRFHKDF